MKDVTSITDTRAFQEIVKRMKNNEDPIRDFRDANLMMKIMMHDFQQMLVALQEINEFIKSKGGK